MTPLLRELASIVRDAAEIVREVYSGDFEVSFKAPHDPVTRADTLANQLICRRLRDAFPAVPIVAEESPPERFAEYRSSERIFFVDPLDGTREFVKRNGEFCMMIGAVDGNQAIAGVIHSPLLSRTWCGEVGQGAFALDESGEQSRISVSAIASAEHARVVVSRSDPSALVTRALSRFGSRQVRPLGSAGLKGVAVATGEAEAYVAPRLAGMRWDVCAVDALVRAAGGAFSDASGGAIDYRAQSLINDRGVIASNGGQHELLLQAIAASQ